MLTSEEFVRRLRIAVYDSAIDGTLANLQKPPGRQPHARYVEMSKWYNALNASDQARVVDVVREATRSAVFGLLCVLDNVRSIRDLGESVGELELRYVVDSESAIINGPDSEMLHDLFAADVLPG